METGDILQHLPDDMIIEICQKMNNKQLSVFMRTNKRIKELCQHIMNERKLIHDRCREIMSKISKRKNAEYYFKNVKIHMKSEISNVLLFKPHIMLLDDYKEFTIESYYGFTGFNESMIPNSYTYKIKQVILDKRIRVGRGPTLSAFIIYKDECNVRDVTVNIYDILINSSIGSESSDLTDVIKLIIEEYKENLRSCGILPHDITFKNNYFIGYKYKTIKVLAKYIDKLADMHMIDKIWRDITLESGVNYEFVTTNIQPLINKAIY